MEIRLSDKDFNLVHTFECGQCFRWNKQSDGSYVGVAGGRAARLRQDENGIILECGSREDFDEFWKSYFDLDRNYAEIKQAVRINDVMKVATDFGGGIRILRQEFFEAVISYIISQNNSIPNIKRVIERLCAGYGEKIEFEATEYRAFPSPETLAALDEKDFRAVGAGFRDRYLVGAARLVAEGKLDGAALEAMPTEQARRELMKIKGVGNKVCDCVLLFALGKYDLFPTDTWINQVMNENFATSSVKEAKAVGESAFGKYSGFAQQYLFYWRRELDKNEKKQEKETKSHEKNRKKQL